MPDDLVTKSELESWCRLRDGIISQRLTNLLEAVERIEKVVNANHCRIERLEKAKVWVIGASAGVWFAFGIFVWIVSTGALNSGPPS